MVRLPVSGLSWRNVTNSTRMLVSCILVEFVTLRQDGDIFATVALTWCDISQGAMTVGFVVPITRSVIPPFPAISRIQGDS